VATIYLAWSAGGEYDDAWKKVICARSTKEAAQSVINDKQVEDEYLRELDKNLREHMAGWLPKIAEIPYQENQTERFMERKNEEVRYLTEVAGLSQEDAEEKATNSYFGKWHPPDDVHYYITETEFE